MHNAVILVGLFLVLSAGRANAERSETLLCLGGLKAISSEISSSHPELSPRLARGLRGNLLMIVNERGPSVTLDDLPPASPSDAKACVGQDVDQAALTILLKAYFGYLSDDPYTEFIKCFAGFMSVATEIERRHGEKVGYEFGFMAGRKLGAQLASLNYLYTISGPSGDAIQQMAAKRLEEISNVPDPEKERHIEKYLDMCEWYGVSIRSMYDGAMALDRTN